MPFPVKEGISRPRLRSMLKNKADFDANPRAATFLALWEMRQEVMRVIESFESTLGENAKAAVLAEFSKMQKDLEKQIQEIVDEMPGFRNAIAEEFAKIVIDQVNKIYSLPEIKGEPGKPGKNGKDANEDRIIAQLTRRMRKDIAFAVKKIPVPKPGKDGSPDKPEDIRKKLETLKGSWLSMSAIDGLKEWLERIEHAARAQKKGGGGGGMGQVQHESFNLTAATTSVTTAYPIAGGRAIWAQYQNGGLTYGVGFSVGANRRAVSLLFTPLNGTFLDVTYIRG